MKKFILFLILAPGMLWSQNKVCVTFDDLPAAYMGNNSQVRSLTQRLMSCLKKYGVPATGFVNEGKLYRNGKPDTSLLNSLELWYKNGFELGNHTYSHINIGRSTVAQYTADIKKGETITRSMAGRNKMPYRYFRHTQLRTGPDEKYKTGLDSSLKRMNYTVAPVTIDNDEYVFAWCYEKAKALGDSTTQRIIAYHYMVYMRRTIAFYENLSKDFLGYNVPHVLLLHANELNADHLPLILDVLKDRDYTFVPLDEVLQDKAYQLPEAISGRGLSWIQRWMLAAGKPLAEQPAVPQQVSNMYDHFRQNEKKRYASQVLNGDINELAVILKNISGFSQAYMNGEIQELVRFYTDDAKLLPGGSDVLTGTQTIENSWRIPEGQKVLLHRVTPLEITLTGDTAYDHGYYEGETQYADGRTARWYGKYVIVWKKAGGEWKIYLDIWNRL